MWDLLSLPFREIGGFFEVSIMGALAYVACVIGVLTPGGVKLLRAIKTPVWVAWPLSALGCTMIAGFALRLLFGDMTGGFDSMMPEIPTHQLAIDRLNGCPAATAVFGTPIKLTATGKGSYETHGGFGASGWKLEVAGPRKTGSAVYSAEMHGGKWGMTHLAIEYDTTSIDLASCTAGTAEAAPPLRVTKEQLVGLWTTDRANQVLVTRFDADGRFTSGMFVDDNKVAVIRGTWELADTALIWHYDRARSEAPQQFWDQLGEARIQADKNPIVELSKVKLAIQEVGGAVTELRPTDPARLGSLLQQMP